MKDKRKKEIFAVLLVLLLIGITIGYAALSANLSINGTSQIKGNTWDIHFANIVVNSNSVSIGTGDSAATVNPNDTTEITYTVSLDKPGDFYEFTADIVNAGTVDGMISSLTSTVNNQSISNLPDYLLYSCTYADGTAVQINHSLLAGTTEKIKVKVEYKSDIDESDMPDDDESITISVSTDYIQLSTSGISHFVNGTVYATDSFGIGSNILEKSSYYYDYHNVPRSYFVLHEVEDNIVTSRKLGVVNGDKYAILTGGNNGSFYDEDLEILRETFDHCSYYNGYASCGTEDVYVTAFDDGDICAGSGLYACHISPTGGIGCDREDHICRGG